jgi:alpha-ribazole phosphatase
VNPAVGFFVSRPADSREPVRLRVDSGEGLIPDQAADRDPAEFHRFRQDPRSATAPGGERMADVEARVLLALRSMAARHEGESFAAVSHEIPIRLVIAALAEIEGAGFWDVRVPTGSLTRLGHVSGSLDLEDEVVMEGSP